MYGVGIKKSFEFIQEGFHLLLAGVYGDPPFVLYEGKVGGTDPILAVVEKRIIVITPLPNCPRQGQGGSPGFDVDHSLRIVSGLCEELFGKSLSEHGDFLFVHESIF